MSVDDAGREYDEARRINRELEAAIADVAAEASSLTSRWEPPPPPLVCPPGRSLVEQLRWWAMALCDARSHWSGIAVGLRMKCEDLEARRERMRELCNRPEHDGSHLEIALRPLLAKVGGSDV